jgi:hypothetical protein
LLLFFRKEEASFILQKEAKLPTILPLFGLKTDGSATASGAVEPQP